MSLKHLPAITNFLTSLSIICAGSLYIYNYHKDSQTELSANIVYGNAKQVSLLVSNTGGKDIAIKDVYMSVGDLSINNKVQIKGLGILLKKSETKLIESLNSQLNSTVIFNPKDWPDPSIVGTTPCNLIIEYIDTDGTKNKLTKDNKCFAGSVINK